MDNTASQLSQNHGNKITYLQNFDGPDERSPWEMERKSKVSQEELRAAQESSYAQGLAQGRADMLVDLQGKMYDLLVSLQEKMAVLIESQEKNCQKILEDAVVIATTIAQKHAVSMGEKHAVDRCVAFVSQTLSRLLEKQTFEIRVHSSLHAGIVQEFGQTDHVIIADDNLDTLDCRLSWSGGGAYVAMQSMVQHIDQLVESWKTIDNGETSHE